MPIDDDLVEAFVEKRAVIFAGAGVSFAAGLPSWKGLMEALRGGITDCPHGEFSPLDLAQYYLNEHKAQGLASKLSEILEKKTLAPSDIHRILVRLSADRIYTTNFDRLLETASEKEGRPATEIWDPSQFSRRTDGLQVIKLHGSLTLPKSLVITAEHFEGYFETHRFLAEEIAAELRKKTVLFVGYSFSDPDIRTILRTVDRQADGWIGDHFILQFNPKKPVIDELNRRGLKVIPLNVPDFSTERATAALERWLRELEDLVHAKTPHQCAIHNLPRLHAKLVARSHEKDSVMQGIRNRQAVAITGPPGIGKTTLAMRIAHDFAISDPRQFEYIVWFSAREHHEQPQWLNDLFDTIGETLGSGRIAQKGADQLHDKETEVNVLLDRHRTLIILDNFEIMQQPELILWIRKIPHTSKILVTSGIDLDRLFPGSPYPLDPVRDDAAFELLDQYAQDFNSAEIVRDRERAVRLIHATSGNPLALKLALGIVQRDPSRLEAVTAMRENLRGGTEDVLAQLYEWAWDSLDSDAEQLLLIPAVFTRVGSIRREALEAAARLGEHFTEALQQVQRLALLETSTSGRYLLHGQTRRFALTKLDARPKLRNEVRARCAEYYLKFLDDTIKRSSPPVRYWNALVTEKMKEVDREWPMLRELLDWASQDGDYNREYRDRVLIEFVMLLVHYMDSRFLNRERLQYVRAAAEALRRRGVSGAADEALLRIDALGWTYVEESDWESAHREIDEGYRLAQSLSSDDQDKLDLLALARTWKARALIEQGQSDEAQAAIQEALKLKSGCSPWIAMRVNMAAGDIALKGHRDHEALRYFEEAAAAAGRYGPEGAGYQIKPRLGMALINLDRADEATVQFNALCDPEGVPIGKLYGEYGLALVAHAQGDVNDAVRRVNSARQQLEQKTASNLLLKLLNEFSAHRAVPLQPAA